jgi:uncharacterized protein (TIGR03437 family)
MRFYLPALAVFAALPALAQISGSTGAPFYTSDSIVNAATQTAGALAPNAIATIYGTDLAYFTRAVASSDIIHGLLPTKLDDNLDGTVLDTVQVWFNAQPCPLFYVSPTQINFQIPYRAAAGTASIVVAHDGRAGLPVDIQIRDTSPGIFLWGDKQPLAVHLSGELISDLSPALPGEIIVIYADGLGQWNDKSLNDIHSGQLATAAFPIQFAPQLQVLLNGIACPAGSVLYAGTTPGFAGLYQINLQLPLDAPPNPQIQLAIGDDSSPGFIQLAIQSFLAGASRNGSPAGNVQ